MITVFPNTILFISLFVTKEMPQFARYAMSIRKGG